MDIQSVLKYLDSAVGDPSKGLPEEVFRFASSIVPMINVDLLIKNEKGETLLTWREDEFYPSGWHIPGGIIRYKETASERIMAVASNELGVSVFHSDTPLAISELIMKEPSWRVRGHFISFLYDCKLLGEPSVSRTDKGVAPKPGEWDWHGNCPENLYAAQEIYRKYISGTIKKEKSK